MKTTYAQNNTRSLFVIVASLALALVLFAALLGLSDKPDVTTIGLSSGSDELGIAAPNSADAGGADADSADGGVDSAEQDAIAQTTGQQGAATTATLQPIVENGSANAAPTSEPQPTPAPQATTTIAPAPVPTVAPTATPVPEIAAAVEPLPTSLPAAEASVEVASDAATTDSSGAAGATPATTITNPSGTVVGNFFTRADEDEGATVARNEVTLTFDESGGGSFRGVLDISYANGSQVQIDMGGAFVYAPTPPQVMGTVNGTYRRDAVDDLEDVTTERGDLSITSFVSGTGALCTPTCFGFTFPPPGS